jgi:hypothetical protein
MILAPMRAIALFLTLLLSLCATLAFAQTETLDLNNLPPPKDPGPMPEKLRQVFTSMSNDLLECYVFYGLVNDCLIAPKKGTPESHDLAQDLSFSKESEIPRTRAALLDAARKIIKMIIRAPSSEDESVTVAATKAANTLRAQIYPISQCDAERLRALIRTKKNMCNDVVTKPDQHLAAKWRQ